MHFKIKNTSLIGWIGRILSLASLSVILMFIVGDGFSPSYLKVKEAILFVFFPFGVCAGMVIAWRKERLGGAITVISLGLFYLLYQFLCGGLPRGYAFLMFSLPGFVFLFSQKGTKRISS